MSITFTRFHNHDWEDKINQSLNSYLEAVTKRHLPTTQGIYCFHETQLIGGVLFELQGDILWIENIFVDEKFRKKNVGRQLLNELSQYASQHNAKEIQLNTFFKEAKDFFKSCQFEEITSIPNWKYGTNCYFLKKSI